MSRNKMKKDHALGIDWGVFYRTVIALVVPMALQNLINVGVTAADVIMLGAVGETALSGASLAGQVQYIMTLFLFGLTSGATVLTAQYWGKGDVKTIEKILGMTVKAAIAVTALFTLAALAIPELLMMIFTSDPAVIAEGVRYLRIVAFTYVMIGITQAYLYVMRSVERVIVATVVYLCSLLCNIVMNSIFIFGLFGLPAMGVAGAALGTLCARILEVILTFGYARIFNKEIKLRPKYILHTDRELFRDFMKYALPVVANEIMWGLGTAANTAILGHLGSSAVAANSVAQVARQLATVVSFGLSSAAAIYLGKTIGEKKLEHEDHRGEEAGTRQGLCEAVHLAQSHYGRTGRPDHLGGIGPCRGGAVAYGHGERILADHVLRYVLFCDRTGVQHDYGGGDLPFRRRHPVRSDPGCEHHVGLLDPARIYRGVCI